jgi:hypothetical protein
MANRLLGSLVVGLSLGFAACSGENLTLPSEGEPAAIAVTGGNGQSGRVGTDLAPLIVLVTDTKNRPVAGATVEFDFTQSGGQANPASAVTGSDGQASTVLRLGTQVGSVSGVARVPVPAGRAPVQTTFTATAVSSDANGIALVSGDNQTGMVGTKLAQPLVVQVTDGFGNPISGVTVGWSVTGGGSVSAPLTDTDVNGQASVERTLGLTAGTQTTLASASGLAGSPVTFTHTANAGNVSSVVKISGDVGSAAAGTTVGLVVEVRDADGNPISGASVNWVVGEGGGNVTPANNTTGSDGRASAQWTLGSAPATNTLTAVSGGATATFTITGTGTGSPSKLAITTQPPPSVEIGQTLSPAPVVQIKDNAGHDVAVPGVDITVVLKSAGSARLEGTLTVTSDANGRATFSDLKVTGATGGRQLLFTADGYTSATSTKFDVNKASTTTAITADDPDPSDQNVPVTVSFTVSSSAGTPTGDVEVTISGGGGAPCTGTLSSGSGSCQLTGLTTPGDRTVTATYKGSPLFATSSGTAIHTVNPPVGNPAPVANNDAYTATAGTTLSEGVATGVLANDTDDSGDIMTAHVVDDVTNGVLQFDPSGSGAFDYTPNPGATSDTFTYNVTDLHGNTSNTATVTITIQ